MALLNAFGYYLIRLVVFAVVAGLGIMAGIRFRKKKDAKAGKEQTNE